MNLFPGIENGRTRVQSRPRIDANERELKPNFTTETQSSLSFQRSLLGFLSPCGLRVSVVKFLPRIGGGEQPSDPTTRLPSRSWVQVGTSNLLSPFWEQTGSRTGIQD